MSLPCQQAGFGSRAHEAEICLISAKPKARISLTAQPQANCFWLISVMRSSSVP